ncbi:exodeoxyribonuclease VII large subunit [Actinomyces minihominis]|uniref:exodeoxyribonuclease VII large subunit n=1 Tax=Actinomyces minihominis TaxID=2002838 RepID=UPI000C075FCE|nr:exodeoxyribonuclease VII large subunit [Actinomyces minihominis]
MTSNHVPPNGLARTARETTAENPWPLRLLTSNIRVYVEKMSELWVEGQVVQYNPRGSTQVSFFTLRDVNEDVSMQVTAFGGIVASSGDGFGEGARVAVRVKPSFWEKRGTLSLQAKEIRLQGLGSLLAQIEKLRQQLAAEGLFNADQKKPLPFIPRRIGLICGRDAKAKDDVLENARVRWPMAQFEIREVAVQGQYAVHQVSSAIEELDAIPEIDVIVVARGGGSVEDLLPFSDERIVRTAANATTPIVSAIGHEGDAPLLDLVADYRASTPTDAARRIVPDYREELKEVHHYRVRGSAAVGRMVTREWEILNLLMRSPVLQRPTATIEQQAAGLEQAVIRLRAAAQRTLSQNQSELAQLTGMLRTLSPTGTLERGYSILRTSSKKIIRSAEEIKSGTLIEGMLSQGTFVANVVGSNPTGSFITPQPTDAESQE